MYVVSLFVILEVGLQQPIILTIIRPINSLVKQ